MAAAKAIAGKLAATYGTPRDISPGEWLLEEMRATAGTVSWLRELVQQLAVGDLVWGDAEKIVREGGNDAAIELTQRAGVSVWVQLLQAERKHGVETARIILAAGVDERLLRLEELKAGAYLAAIDALLDRLELTAEQRSRAALELPGVLVAVAERSQAER